MIDIALLENRIKKTVEYAEASGLNVMDYIYFDDGEPKNHLDKLHDDYKHNAKMLLSVSLCVGGVSEMYSLLNKLKKGKGASSWQSA